MDILLHTLGNGIRLVHVGTGSAVAYFGIAVNAGSRDEGDSEHGIAHFTEHMFFKGTARRKSFHIFSRIEDVGGELNAYTTKEETVFYTSFLKDDCERAVELLADVMCNSVFPEKEIQKEKDVVIDEINSYLDSPAELIFDEFDEQIFGAGAIGHSILGKPETVSKFTRDDICRFVAQHYAAGNMVVFSAGNISNGKIIKLVEKYFGACSPARSHSPRTKTGSEYRQSDVAGRNDTFHSHCIIGTRAYNITHRNHYGMCLLNSILGGHGLNSRLNMELREKRGLAYTVESGYTPYSDTGVFSIYFAADKKHIEKCLSVTFREMHRLCTQKLGTVQLCRAKKQLKGYAARSFENHENMAIGMAKSLVSLNRTHTLEDICMEIDAITALQMMDIANEILDSEKMSMLTYSQK
ncbi:MAG: insulinase family protein [Bacteroidales bacterium]|nr:insulinase family protein [Bacteroidales bacterium]